MKYFTEYEVHTCEEGWYIYFQPNDLRVRAIRENLKPICNREAAEKEVRRFNQNMQ